jgi:hypothetical protein
MILTQDFEFSEKKIVILVIKSEIFLFHERKNVTVFPAFQT